MAGRFLWEAVIPETACCCGPHMFLPSGPINISNEAVYWTTSVDGSHHSLCGKHNYVIRFPAGKLPPNNAFWSLTMGDGKNRFVPNPLNRYSVSDRTGLVPNKDGSVTVYIQNKAPAGYESNWLPAPENSFTLWLRVYLPGEEILNGRYIVPPIERDTVMEHLVIFFSCMILSWFIVIRFLPYMLLGVYKRAILVKGFEDGPIPINTLIYTIPNAICRPAPYNGFLSGNCRDKPRHAPHGRMAGSKQRPANIIRARYGRQILQYSADRPIQKHQLFIHRKTRYGNHCRDIPHQRPRLERCCAAGNDTNSFPKQFCIGDRQSFRRQ